MHPFLRLGAVLLALCCVVSSSSDIRQVGNACFCKADTDSGNKCDCDAMSALTLVYLGKGLEPAASIVLYDAEDDPTFVCLFEDVSVGHELECRAGSKAQFPDEVVFSIESGDGEVCEGTLDTSCSESLLNSFGEDHEGDACDALRIVVSGWVGAQGQVCDDGYAPCDCDEAEAEAEADTNGQQKDGDGRTADTDSDADVDAQSDDEQDSDDETSTTSWSEPWTSTTTTTSTSTSSASSDEEVSEDTDDWSARYNRYVQGMDDSSPASTATSDVDSDSNDDTDTDVDDDDSSVTASASASISASASDDSQTTSTTTSTTVSSDSASSDDDDSESNADSDDDDVDSADDSSSNNSDNSSSNANVVSEDNDDDDDDDDNSVDESYDDNSASSGDDDDTTSDSDSDSNNESDSDSGSNDETEIADSNSADLDSEIGDSDDAAYSDSGSDSDSDSNAIATGMFGLITALDEGDIESTEGEGDSVIGYAADFGSLVAVPAKFGGDELDTTPYEKYSFFTLLAILLLNVTAFGWCLCTQVKRTAKGGGRGGKQLSMEFAEKIEIVEAGVAADDTEDDDTEDEEDEEEEEEREKCLLSE